MCVDHFEVLFELRADPFKVVEDLPEVLLDDVQDLGQFHVA